MKKMFLLLTLFVAIAGIFFSCRKETSCEGCRGNNKPPIAVAGPDQVITLPSDTVLLDGNSSSDPDGTISEWLWKKISGPAFFNIVGIASAKATVHDLDTGRYLFELRVKDNGGLLAKDTVQVVVIDPAQPNRPPVAIAGADQTITLPMNTVNLDGNGSTDPDNNITAYFWTKISGPSSFNIDNANTVQIQVTNLVQGNYQFELKVTDATGLFAKDTIQVIVNIQQVIVNPQLPACTTCRIVFVTSRDGNAEIYSCNVDGSNIQRLTNEAGYDDQPAWSPDGTKIAFISYRTGNPELYIMNRDGSNVIRKTFSGSCQNPTWSPDGTKIAYSTMSNGSSNIWVVGVMGGSPLLLFEAPGWDAQPTWSPDGTKIALVSDWAAYDFVSDIYTVNANGTGFTALTGNFFDPIDYLNPSWSPSGAMLAMAVSEMIGINQYNTQIGIMNSNGGGISVIMLDAAPWARTSWSGDGTRIAYTSLFGSRYDVSWVSADGSTRGTIVTNGWNADWQH